jgi:broad specificity phosphatase PhoE
MTNGRPIHLFVIRHSKSCSNYMRQLAGTHDRRNPLVRASQEILDPALSAVGRQMAEHYRPTLQKRLEEAGFNIEAATIGCSGLRRARETAQLLFPGHNVQHMPHIKEYGNIPENTPLVAKRCRPDWHEFLRYVYNTSISQLAVVGHGSFLGKGIWKSVSKEPHARFSNLDGILISAILTEDGQFMNPQVTEFKYKPPAYISGAADQCSAAVESKIAKHSKMKRVTKKWKRSRRQLKSQRGGGVNMPLAYFQDGAQMNGTYPEPTGTGLVATSNSWVRAALNQTGGRRGTRKQQGGFSPSIMGSFVANGSRLIPAAGYMGYRMFEKAGKTRKGRRGHRATRRDRK